jgi:hypothetical protein
MLKDLVQINDVRLIILDLIVHDYNGLVEVVDRLNGISIEYHQNEVSI